MKRLLALMLALAMVMALAACGKDGGETPDNTEPDTTASTEAKLEEKTIVEDLEGVGPVKLSNSYVELTVPKGYGYKITDANDKEGESQFWVELEIKNADGTKIGEFEVSNTGSYDNVDEYVQSDIDYYKNSSSVTLGEPVSEKYGIFDGRYLVKHNSNWDDYRFYGFYLIPDEAAEYRNVRAELDINGYSYQDKEFPKADFANLLSSIVIK